MHVVEPNDAQLGEQLFAQSNHTRWIIGADITLNDSSTAEDDTPKCVIKPRILVVFPGLPRPE